MITFSSDAAEDLGRIYSFLDKLDRIAAQRALDRVWSAISKLEDFPLLGAATENSDVRQLFIQYGIAGYIVRYFVDPTTHGIVITRIWHSREARE